MSISTDSRPGRSPETLKRQGVATELFVIPGEDGHLDGLTDIAKAGDAIRAFLGK